MLCKYQFGISSLAIEIGSCDYFTLKNQFKWCEDSCGNYNFHPQIWKTQSALSIFTRILQGT